MQNTPNSQGSEGRDQKPSLSWSSGQSPMQQKMPMPSSAGSVKADTSSQKKNNEGKSRTGTYSSIFIAGLVIGGLLVWGFTSGRINTGGGVATNTQQTTSSMASDTVTPSTQSAPATTPTAIDLSNSSVGGLGGLTLLSEQTAGFQVAVSHVSVSQPTWVVIYEDHGGVPGNALGAGLFFSQSVGGDTSGTIQLLRGTLPGQSYLAGESVDDGDHIFSTQNDKPVRDAKGNPLMVEFTTK